MCSFQKIWQGTQLRSQKAKILMEVLTLSDFTNWIEIYHVCHNSGLFLQIRRFLKGKKTNLQKGVLLHHF